MLSGQIAFRLVTGVFKQEGSRWEIKDRKGKVRFFAKFRSACLEWEQTNLQPE